MGFKKARKLLGIYDLMLFAGAVMVGGLMISSTNTTFTDYPKEWLTKLPFDSWFMIGVFGIIIFGGGNLVTSILTFRSHTKIAWSSSGIMGGILLIVLLLQRMLLKEWYLATIELLILSVIQIGLSAYAYLCFKKDKN